MLISPISPDRSINSYECVEADGGEKIVAVDVGDSEFTDVEVICNPNDCARNTPFDFSRCDAFGTSGGPCGDAYLRTCPD